MSEDNHEWLNQFIVDIEEEKKKEPQQRRLDELERMKKAASATGGFYGMASNLSQIDPEKYLAMCEFFEKEIRFTCDVPEGWEEEYAKHMQEKMMKFGSGGAKAHRIKANGKRRLF